MLVGWQYESGLNNLKTLPYVGRRLEMPDPSLVCGNNLRKLADQAKNVSWYVLFIAYVQALNKSFRIFYVGGAF